MRPGTPITDLDPEELASPRGDAQSERESKNKNAGTAKRIFFPKKNEKTLDLSEITGLLQRNKKLVSCFPSKASVVERAYVLREEGQAD